MEHFLRKSGEFKHFRTWKWRIICQISPQIIRGFPLAISAGLLLTKSRPRRRKTASAVVKLLIWCTRFDSFALLTG